MRLTKVNIRKYLNAFYFNHIDKQKKTVTPTKLSKYFSCSEIVRTLIEQEGGGGFTCANCHEVIYFDKHIPLLDQIYEDEIMVRRVLEDYYSVLEKFAPIYKSPEVKDPLKQLMRISDSFEKYITAIGKILKSENVVTNESIANEMLVSDYSVVLKFFGRNSALKEKFMNIEKINISATYILTNKGIEIFSLIQYFEDYYNSI